MQIVDQPRNATVWQTAFHLSLLDFSGLVFFLPLGHFDAFLQLIGNISYIIYFCIYILYFCIYYIFICIYILYLNAFIYINMFIYYIVLYYISMYIKFHHPPDRIFYSIADEVFMLLVNTVKNILGVTTYDVIDQFVRVLYCYVYLQLYYIMYMLCICYVYLYVLCNVMYAIYNISMLCYVYIIYI